MHTPQSPDSATVQDTEDTIDTLNTLIETSKDGEYGFRTSAAHLSSVDTREQFLRRADQCAEGAAELQTLVTHLGGSAEHSGTAVGAVHRGWVGVKGTLTGYSDKAILEETERGEDSALSSYRKALEQPLPVEVRTVVERQLVGVQRNHADIRALRDQARNAAS
jgi:uncharacterized protein (TIGR02284 family)